MNSFIAPNKTQNWKRPFYISVSLFALLVILQFSVWTNSDSNDKTDMLMSLLSLLGYFGLTSRLIFKLSQFEDKILAQQSYFKELADSAFEGIILTHEEKIMACNASFCELFNTPAQFLIGSDVASFFPANHGELFEVSRARLGQDSLTLQVQRKKFKHFGSEWVYSVRDISEQKKQEILVQERTAQILSANRLANLGEMASGIAHEVNNPLAIIMGRSKILLELAEKDLYPPEKYKDGLEKIVKTANRIARVVKTMLSMSRDIQPDQVEEFDLIEVLSDTLSLGREKFETMGIQINTKWPDSSCMINGNPSMIGQVLLNLLVNARDAVIDLPEKWVNLEVRDAVNSYQLIVTDSGRGIPVAHRDKIFQPFYTTKDPGEGTGLGLSLSQSIIKKHLGHILLNVDFPNTQFIVSIPKSLAQSPSGKHQAS